MNYQYKLNTKKSSLQTKQTKQKPLENKVLSDHNSEKDSIRDEFIRQAHWGFNLKLIFLGAGSAIAFFACILCLNGKISKTVCIGIGGIALTTVGGIWMQLSREANNQLFKVATKEPEKQLDKPDSEVDYLPDSEAQDSEIDLSEEANEDTLTTALEKIDLAIRSDGRNG
jgi:hypothetical protein